MSVDVEVKADLTEATNDVLKGVLSMPAKESGKAIGTLLAFFNNTIMLPMQKYNLKKENELKAFAEELGNRVNDIPIEKLVEPSINIIGPVMEGLKYNLDEKYIKDIFLNILVADMNSDKKQKVLPSYVEIVKQLSYNDAELLKSLDEIKKESKMNGFSLVDIVIHPLGDKKSYVPIDKVIVVSKSHTITPKQIVLDNLIRLGLITYYENRQIADSQLYEMGDTLIKTQYKNLEANGMSSVSYNKSILSLTDYGIRFLDICMEDK